MDAAVFTSLSEILDYPGPHLHERIEACIATLGADHPASGRLREFARVLGRAPVGGVQESYTAAFDLDESCSPHVGQRLLGRDPRRGVFLARLAGRFRASGFSCGRELPDHIAVLLRFLAHAPDDDDRGELVRDCLLPAVTSLSRELARRSHPYAAAAEAVRLVLEEDAREEGSR